MFNSTRLTNLTSWLKSLQTKTDTLQTTTDAIQVDTAKLLSHMSYAYTVTTGTDGTYELDYSALNLTKIPKIVLQGHNPTITDIPFDVKIIGQQTTTKVKIKATRLTSILSLGLVPQYQGVSGVQIDVIVKLQP